MKEQNPKKNKKNISIPKTSPSESRSIYMKISLIEELEQIAIQNDVSFNFTVCWILHEYLHNTKLQPKEERTPYKNVSVPHPYKQAPKRVKRLPALHKTAQTKQPEKPEKINKSNKNKEDLT